MAFTLNHFVHLKLYDPGIQVKANITTCEFVSGVYPLSLCPKNNTTLCNLFCLSAIIGNRNMSLGKAE